MATGMILDNLLREARVVPLLFDREEKGMLSLIRFPNEWQRVSHSKCRMFLAGLTLFLGKDYGMALGSLGKSPGTKLLLLFCSDFLKFYYFTSLIHLIESAPLEPHLQNADSRAGGGKSYMVNQFAKFTSFLAFS